MKIVFMIGLAAALSLPSFAPSNHRQVQPYQAARGSSPQASRLGTINGRAAESGTDKPMRRVVVSCVSDRGSSSETTTGADGRFQIKDLGPGRYLLSARRAGYLGSPARAKSHSPQPIPIDITAGETVGDVNFKFVRAGAISGRIVDDFGDPLVNARVTARRWVFTEGGRRPEVAAATDTDDLGEFRLSDLAPGSYYVAATFPSPGAKTVGRRRGSEEPLVFWSYYPGAPTVAQARPILVRAGADVASIDFALAAQRPASVSGTVVDLRGRPAANAIVVLKGTGPEAVPVGAMATVAGGQHAAIVVGGKGIMDGVRVGPSESDGRFEFSWAWPGEYVVTAYRQPGLSASIEFASGFLTVGGTDLANLSLVLVGGGEPVHGRIRADEELPRLGTGPVRVRAVSGENDDLVDRLRLPANGLVNANWTFEIPRLPGRRLICVDGLPPEWAVKAVVQGTHTTTDALLELQPGSPQPGITILLTKHPTEVSGAVVGPDAAPIADYAVVAFASDPSLWPFAPRFVQLERPNQHGEFRFRGLAPGEFLLAAVPYVDATEWRDPEFLERLRPLATPVLVREDTSRPITLRLIAEDPR
jgi:hypothetical protein